MICECWDSHNISDTQNSGQLPDLQQTLYGLYGLPEEDHQSGGAVEVLDAAQVDGEGEVVGGRRYGQVSGGGGLTVHCVKERRVRVGPQKSKQDLLYKY